MGAKEVIFKNSHGSTVFVAYSRWDQACKDDCGDPWDVLG